MLNQNQSKFFNRGVSSIVLLLIVVGVLTLAGGIWYWQSRISKQPIQPPTSTIKTIKQSITTSTSTEYSKGTSTEITIEKTTEPTVIDCGTVVVNFQKLDCFISAAKNCSSAKITINSQVNFFGFIIEGTNFLELKGWQENKCLFYVKPISAKVTFSQEAIQDMLDSGVTKEQIKQQEQESSKLTQSTIGRDGICKFADISNLISLLNKWQEGSFSSDDFKNIDCNGEYFSQPEQQTNISKTITEKECIEQKGHYAAVTDKRTACFKNEIDLGRVVGNTKLNDQYPQCCVSK